MTDVNTEYKSSALSRSIHGNTSDTCAYKMETELCEHCKKEVPAENYLMHSAHCKRNIQLCPLCGQAISRKDAKEHLQEYHEKIDCVQCGQKTTRIDEETHLVSECAKTLIPCRYCDILLPREKMLEHQDFCGSRTELCEKCNRYVMMNDLQKHETCCLDYTVLPCELCGALISYDRLDSHQLQCMNESQTLRGDIPLLVEGEDGLFREVAMDAMETEAMSNHDRTGSGNDSATGSNEETIAKKGHSDNSIVALPCEICGELCPSDRLMEHQERCGQESDNDGNQEEPRELNFRFDSNPYSGMDNYDDGLFPEGIHRVFGSLIQQRLLSDLGDRMWPFNIMRN